MENALEKLPMRRGGTAARIAVIPGDGIGKEVTPEAVKVLMAVTAATQRAIQSTCRGYSTGTALQARPLRERPAGGTAARSIDAAARAHRKGYSPDGHPRKHRRDIC